MTPSQPTFRICTFATDIPQYAAMRASFDAAGFTAKSSIYTLLDNSRFNAFEPYRTIPSTAAETREDYLIFCHQDVRIDRGHTRKDLVDRLNHLNDIAPTWAVAGNAGRGLRGEWLLHLDHPGGKLRAPSLPREVLSLDESFLVINPQAVIRTSLSLTGFHLYGTDLVLNARLHKQTSWVIDFLLTHMSGGNSSSESYIEGRRRFINEWSRKPRLGVVCTVIDSQFTMSRYRLLRPILRRRVVASLLRRSGISFIP